MPLNRITLGLALLLMSAGGQELKVPSSDAEWRDLESRLKRDPFVLAAAPREEAVAVIRAALRTRPDGILWAAYGPAVCTVGGPDRATLEGNARRLAYQASRECAEAIISELDRWKESPQFVTIQYMLTAQWVDALLETGELAVADSVAAEAMSRISDADEWARGNIRFEMSTIRGRVALRRDDVARSVEFMNLAGTAAASPQLSSFGPRLVLARELLEVGERPAVLAFLDSIARFWVGAGAEVELAEARRLIRAGGIPDGVRWH